MSITGQIHSIETFGTVDGPGIRYIVFMQGCPLRCLYCHNRDAWNPKSGRTVTVDEILDDLQNYVEYFKFSQGGITLSGGEPTMQIDFVTELFKQCKKLGIHTALDTSGYIEVKKVYEFLNYTDLVLLDIKQAVKEKHKLLTGVDLDIIHKFAQYLSEIKIPVWIRYVLIPGYTDAQKDLELAAEFINTLKNVEKIEVLPYHSLGQYKWNKIGVDYTLKDIEPPSQKEVEKAKSILSSKFL
ncbi:pyruvate formate lyase-activating protein [Alkalibaculum sp. M08DMB]|uniref:Pyruvate formate-lyase-activating enzyme n=1 Tax=Alkalibaculum sporogenes TaxID=2655001 RepID=A0A6A7K5L4_9FIRM|nr:pyruvate formate-lyase-activating protein [Alkalibaculum sporogenes]MPW24641.1 pyruvate formate lyase-activating protein [Alkalibaculum sporogenes]